MHFVTLAKFRHRPTRQDLTAFDLAHAKAKKEGLEIVGDYYTFGRFDNVMVVEAPDEKTVMKFFLSLTDLVSTETLVAVPREQGRKLLG